MNQEQILQLIGFVIFLAVLIPLFLPLLSTSMGFIGDQFCSSSVQVRSMFNNLFLGWIGRAVIPDWIFDLIPLVCNADVVKENANIEETLADEVMKCYNKYGAGDLDGVFPHNSILCSAVVYDGSLEEDNTQTVNLMKVYSMLINRSDFPSGEDSDNGGGSLDYDNVFRFCQTSVYQTNIYTHMVDKSGAYAWEDVGFCKGETVEDEEGTYLKGETCDKSIGKNLLFWLKSRYDDKNSCFSLREAALNNWQLNFSKPSMMIEDADADVGDALIVAWGINSLDTAVTEYEDKFLSNTEDLIIFCKDLCRRKCEYENDELKDYNTCYSNCETTCSNCERHNCGEFTSELGNLTKPVSEGVKTSDFRNNTFLKRGVFYIRFFDYSDWLQQTAEDWFTGGKWSKFRECDNHITLSEASLLGSSKKHDYVAICYKPYVPYSLMHPDQSGGYEQTLVTVT